MLTLSLTTVFITLPSSEYVVANGLYSLEGKVDFRVCAKAGGYVSGGDGFPIYNSNWVEGVVAESDWSNIQTVDVGSSYSGIA